MPEAFLSSFHPLGDSDVAALLSTSWGLTEATWSAFGSERDDTLHVTCAEGEYVLKVSHPTDNHDRLHRQLSVMSFVGKHPLPFAAQTPVPTVTGGLTAMTNGRLAHLLPSIWRCVWPGQ